MLQRLTSPGHKGTREDRVSENAVMKRMSVKSSESMESSLSVKSALWGTKNTADDDKPGKHNFVDASAIKEKVRENLIKPKYNVTDHYKEDGIWQAIAKNGMFEQITLGVIAFNAIWIAVDTDFNGADILLDAHPVFQVAENLFCLFFSMELFIRFMSFQRVRFALKDFWFAFDSALVLTMVLETWIMTLIVLITAPGGSGGGAGMGNASILRIARLLRLTRMARMARLLRAMPELMIMIKGMMAAMRSVFFTLCLLVIIMYVFAVVFTQLCAETDTGDAHFKNVPHSMFTLLMYGTLLDDIGNLTKQLGRESYIIAGVFLVFVLLAALTVMNMLIGVLCEVVSVVAAIEKEEMLVTYVNEKLQKVMAILDADGDLTISKSEFLKILENIDAARCLQDVGVDVIGLVDFADFIFADDSVTNVQLDDDDNQISFAKFTEVVLQLRGTNTATVKDIVDLRKFVRNAMIETNRQLQTLLDQVLLSQKHFRERKRREGRDSSNSRTQSLVCSEFSSIDARRMSREATFNSTNEESRSHETGKMWKSESQDSRATTSHLTEHTQDPSDASCWPMDQVAAVGVSPSPPPISDPVDLLNHEKSDAWSRLDDDITNSPRSSLPHLHGQWYPVESSDSKFHSVGFVTGPQPVHNHFSKPKNSPLKGMQATKLGDNETHAAPELRHGVHHGNDAAHFSHDGPYLEARAPCIFHPPSPEVPSTTIRSRPVISQSEARQDWTGRL